MLEKQPPQPVHVPGTRKGEEMVRRKGREPGRHDGEQGGYRSARDSTSLNPDAHNPIDPRSPCIPPA
jgi:hypothetical protein